MLDETMGCSLATDIALIAKVAVRKVTNVVSMSSSRKLTRKGITSIAREGEETGV